MSDERINVVVTSLLVAALGGLGLLFSILMSTINTSITDARVESKISSERNSKRIARLELWVTEFEKELRKTPD